MERFYVWASHTEALRGLPHFSFLFGCERREYATIKEVRGTDDANNNNGENYRQDDGVHQECRG